MSHQNWPERYADLLARLGACSVHARWTFCGLGACVDATRAPPGQEVRIPFGAGLVGHNTQV